MCVQVCKDMYLNFDFKVKFLVQIHQVMSTRKVLWYSRIALETFEDLDVDLKKGEYKVKALIRTCSKDYDKNMI